MRDGEIINGRVWYKFDYEELCWLYDLIPDSDFFKDRVADAITKLGGTLNQPKSKETPRRLADFSDVELQVLKRLANTETLAQTIESLIRERKIRL